MHLLPAQTLSGENRVHHADLFTLCNALPDASVDLVLFDPPYGTIACEWDVIIPLEPMWAVFRRILKPLGAVVVTASDPFASLLIVSNLDWFKYRTIWKKTRGSGFINAKNRPISIHEDICVFSPGTIANLSPRRMTYNPQGLVYAPYHKKRNKPMTAKAGGYLGTRPSHVSEYDVEYTNYPTSVIEFANPNDNNEHPTQKPLDLFEYLVRTYSNPGDLVVDPTCGSGTTAIAARNTQRRFICGDKEWDYVQIARRRLAEPWTPPLFAEDAS